jgi:hypothetical protein
VVADIKHLIGVDLLSHFGLLVGRKHNRLLNEVTSLSEPAQAASSLTRSKTVRGGTTPGSFPPLPRQSYP